MDGFLEMFELGEYFEGVFLLFLLTTVVVGEVGFEPGLCRPPEILGCKGHPGYAIRILLSMKGKSNLELREERAKLGLVPMVKIDLGVIQLGTR